METAERLPLFRIYTIDELNEMTGYSKAYLVDIEAHPNKANPQFRRMVTRIIKRPEAELFGPATDADGAEAGEG